MTPHVKCLRYSLITHCCRSNNGQCFNKVCPVSVAHNEQRKRGGRVMRGEGERRRGGKKGKEEGEGRRGG